MSIKKKLMVDMDDVICTNGFLHLINNYLGSDYSLDDFKSFYMQDIISDKESFFKWFMTQNIYDYCELTDGCYEVMEELNRVYELYVVTDYVWPEIATKCGFIVEQKFNFLQNNLPFINSKQYMFLTNKNILDMDIKLDDRLVNLEGADIKLLFSAYHNMNYSDLELKIMGIERMNDWFDVKKRLLKK